ncbi:MAG: PGF-CTERM sorting domain-containing protein, partial [Halodesulfurarchaeum sp.]
DVIVVTTRSAANLDPTRRISGNQTVEDVGLEVSDFERDTDTVPDRPEPTQPEPRETDAQSPGFGIGIAIAALLAGTLLLRRVHHE